MDSVSVLKELIKIDSSTREKANEAIAYCVNYLREHGVEGELIENNGFHSFVTTIGSGHPTIVLNGHLDVVSGKKEQFSPIEIDGMIVGRGSADMKSGCVAMLQTIINLKDEPLGCKVMLQLVSDEETGGVHCSKYLVEQGYIGDFVICTEPTNMRVSLQSKGIIRMDVISKGVSAHGSRPWQGVNAITKAFENYDKIEKLPILSIASEFYEGSSLNLAIINGGDIYNRVPDTCTMGFDIRYVPFLDPQDIIEAVKSVIEGEVVVKAVEPGVATKSDNSYIQGFTEVVKTYYPEQPYKFAVQHGGSDGRFFAEQGIPVIEYGPIGNHWHGDDEYVEIESMHQLEKILMTYIRQF